MKVLVYPKSVNPYLELLYGALRRQHPDSRFEYLAATPLHIILFPLVIAWYRLRGYRLFHLHWHAFALSPQSRIPGAKLISFVFSVVCLLSIKLLGYRLVWTVHNARSHEAVTSNDVFVSRLTARLAYRLIVHSRYSLAQLDEHGMQTTRAVVIPHGNYEGWYPAGPNRAAARRQLGVSTREVMVLFFGMIRTYKGVERAVQAIAELNIPTVRLVLAGARDDPALASRLRAAAAVHPQLSLHIGHVDDADVAAYFAAADAVCLPFTAVTTSGSALLALTFGKPLVAPRMGALQDIPLSVGVLYDPADPDALKRSLQAVVAHPDSRKAMATAATAYAATLSWERIATATYRAYTGTDAA